MAYCNYYTHKMFPGTGNFGTTSAAVTGRIALLLTRQPVIAIFTAGRAAQLAVVILA